MEKSLQQFLPDNITQALCHTLIHSLWQGLLLALLTGLIIVLTKNSRSALRYRLLAGALLAFTMTVIGTLLTELRGTAGYYFQFVGVNAVRQGSFIIYLAERLNYLLKSAHEHAGTIVWIWLLLVSVQCFRLSFGVYTLERLKRVSVNSMGGIWEEKLNRLSATLGIRQTVLLLESGIAKVPIVIGYLKPVILVPVGLINSLEPEQVEAILMHELAHILRKDYLVNMLQTIIETLFFFNPAVRWLSSLIRAERENCCDDMVIGNTRNPVGYIRSLVHFEEYRMGLPWQALAFTGKTGSMLGRLERILAGKNRSLGRLELIGLAFVLVLNVLFIAVSPVGQVSSMVTIVQKDRGGGKAMQAKRKAEADATRRKQLQGSTP